MDQSTQIINPVLIATLSEEKSYLIAADGVVEITAVRKLSEERLLPDTTNALILGRIIRGTIALGDDVTFFQGREKKFTDVAASMQKDWQAIEVASFEEAIGMLLRYHSNKDVRRLAPSSPVETFEKEVIA